jgi:hypothetical protein
MWGAGAGHNCGKNGPMLKYSNRICVSGDTKQLAGKLNRVRRIGAF